MPPGALGFRAARSPPPHVAGESSGAPPPLRVGPAALGVRRWSACRLFPSKVSTPLSSPRSPLRFPLFTRAPRPLGRRRRHPPKPSE
jgi:hypothetical protein